MNENVFIEMYRKMLRIREFEIAVKKLYREGMIFGAIHLYIGEEAVAVGVCEALRADDCVTSTHRGHGHLLAKGGDIKKMMAELMGRESGCSRGYGGSMHMFDPACGFLGGNGIVGGGISIALGAAFSAKYRGSDGVAVTFFGEGASNQGTFHECLNLAALWKLPFIAVCENNRYAATTPVEKSTSVEDIAVRSSAYGIPGIIVDGNDCMKVFESAKSAVSLAREGKGPVLIECKTYRMEPHCGIIADLRPKGEREDWKCRDPLEVIKKNISEADDEIFEKIAVDVKTEIEEAIEFASGSSFPTVEKMFMEFGSL